MRMQPIPVPLLSGGFCPTIRETLRITFNVLGGKSGHNQGEFAKPFHQLDGIIGL